MNVYGEIMKNDFTFAAQRVAGHCFGVVSDVANNIATQQFGNANPNFYINGNLEFDRFDMTKDMSAISWLVPCVDPSSMMKPTML